MRFLILLLFLLSANLHAQMTTDSTAFFIRDIYRQSYGEWISYDWLKTLCKDIGHRLAGSEGDRKAIAWAKATMDTFQLDSVWLQPVTVPYWERGDKERVIMITPDGPVSLQALALGLSPGTGADGLKGKVIEVQSLDSIQAMPENALEGKIVFFNRPLDPTQLNTFSAYGNAADQRYSGPYMAAKKGALAAIVRSLSTAHDDYPHTGSTFVTDTTRNIPSVALSTNDADKLSAALKKYEVNVVIQTTCGIKGEASSANVIGEIRGSVHPEKVILVGGHLDSWDVGEGAQDDGAGCVQAMEVLYRLAKNGYRPRHTIRCVLFSNEESGLKGGRKYAEWVIARNEFHVAAIESDGGSGFAQAFGCSPGENVMLDQRLSHLAPYMELLEPYDIELKPGGGGADIGPLKPKAGLLIGLRPESSRYFDYHHSHRDVLETVHPRELASGAAAMAGLVLILDQYGIGL